MDNTFTWILIKDLWIMNILATKLCKFFFLYSFVRFITFFLRFTPFYLHFSEALNILKCCGTSSLPSYFNIHYSRQYCWLDKFYSYLFFMLIVSQYHTITFKFFKYFISKIQKPIHCILYEQNISNLTFHIIPLFLHV